MPSARSSLLPDLFVSTAGQGGHSQADAPHGEMPIPRRMVAPAPKGHQCRGLSLSCSWDQSRDAWGTGSARSRSTVPGRAGGTQSAVPHPQGSAAPPSRPARRLPQLPWALPCTLLRRLRPLSRHHRPEDPRLPCRQSRPAFTPPEPLT